MKNESKIQQLQDAIENDSMTGELKAYIARLQEKLAKVRSKGGSYGRIDFSPYMKNLSAELSSEPEAVTTILETRHRINRGKTTKAI